MNEAQQIVATWLRRTMAEQGLTPERWAAQAGIAATSITRALQDSYPGTSSLPLLHQLARAADVPSPLDFLAGQATLPSEAELIGACTVALSLQPRVTPQEFARLLGDLLQRR